MSDEELVGQIIIGCAKDVLSLENRFYRNRMMPRKVSEKLKASLFTVFPSISENYKIDKGFRPCDINSKLERKGLDKVERQVPYRMVNSCTKIGYYEKESKPNDEQSQFYKESELVSNLKRLALDLRTRAIIYLKLRFSNFLERYLRVLKYAGLIRDKHINVKEAIEEVRLISVEPILEKHKEKFEKGYLENQKILRQKSNKQILMAASRWAKMELIQKDNTWHLDKTYTRFFIEGGIAYNEVQIIFASL